MSLPRGLRIACGVAALAGIGVIAGQVRAQRRRVEDWHRSAGVYRVSELPPRRMSIADLYRVVPPPGRRVILEGNVQVRDTMRTYRPVSYPDGRIHLVPEGLVFLQDSGSGERLVVLKRLDHPGSAWVELMPMPRDIGRFPAVDRWTPLAHLGDLWLAGWADINGPGGLVWLGVDSSVLRAHDLATPTLALPYRLREGAIAGRPGGPPQPAAFTPLALGLAPFVLVLGAVALVGRSRRLHGGDGEG